MSDKRVQMSVRLTTGHMVHVVFPGDDQFQTRRQLHLAMLETSFELRKLADRVQEVALKEVQP